MTGTATGLTSARRRHWLAAFAAAWCACVLVLAPQPAQAGQGNPDPSPSGTGSAGTTGAGYAVRVTLSGSATPPAAVARQVTVAPACWWAQNMERFNDPAAMLKWYDNLTGLPALPTSDMTGLDETAMLGSREMWERAADEQKAGADLRWYRATCREVSDYASFLGRDPTLPGFANIYRVFPANAPVPPPLVKPEDLAQVARDAMLIPVPATDRNPKIGAPGTSTLVGLPTWFWVTDGASVGGAAGTRTIRAQAGGVWAEVTATTGGLRLSSPDGSTLCPPARATTRYAAGVPESAACTVEFSRASVAYPRGYPVTATTGWQATWAGSDGTTGVLAPLARTVTVNVPVAEVQNVVTGSG